ncbi:MAG: hypothetical protein ABII90_14745 [Bacteroidota bacterium]
MIIGNFSNYSPVIKAGISRSGKLIFGRGNERIIVDSGFNGDISAPPVVLDRLDLVYSGETQFQLADGSLVWKDLWAGEVILEGNYFEALFIKGDFLLGMELAADLFSQFLINFDNQKIKLKIRK